MQQPMFHRLPETVLSIEGHVGEYLTAVTDNWLKIAPYANPGMLEMFRDRDRKPYRNMVRWAGWFASMYLIGAVRRILPGTQGFQHGRGGGFEVFSGEVPEDRVVRLTESP